MGSDLSCEVQTDILPVITHQVLVKERIPWNKDNRHNWAKQYVNLSWWKRCVIVKKCGKIFWYQSSSWRCWVTKSGMFSQEMHSESTGNREWIRTHPRLISTKGNDTLLHCNSTAIYATFISTFLCFVCFVYLKYVFLAFTRSMYLHHKNSTEILPERKLVSWKSSWCCGSAHRKKYIFFIYTTCKCIRHFKDLVVPSHELVGWITIESIWLVLLRVYTEWQQIKNNHSRKPRSTMSSLLVENFVNFVRMTSLLWVTAIQWDRLIQRGRALRPMSGTARNQGMHREESCGPESAKYCLDIFRV